MARVLEERLEVDIALGAAGGDHHLSARLVDRRANPWIDPPVVRRSVHPVDAELEAADQRGDCLALRNHLQLRCADPDDTEPDPGASELACLHRRCVAALDILNRCTGLVMRLSRNHRRDASQRLRDATDHAQTPSTSLDPSHIVERALEVGDMLIGQPAHPLEVVDVLLREPLLFLQIFDVAVLRRLHPFVLVVQRPIGLEQPVDEAVCAAFFLIDPIDPAQSGIRRRQRLVVGSMKIVEPVAKDAASPARKQLAAADAHHVVAIAADLERDAFVEQLTFPLENRRKRLHREVAELVLAVDVVIADVRAAAPVNEQRVLQHVARPRVDRRGRGVADIGVLQVAAATVAQRECHRRDALRLDHFADAGNAIAIDASDADVRLYLERRAARAGDCAADIGHYAIDRQSAHHPAEHVGVVAVDRKEDRIEACVDQLADVGLV